MTRAEIAAARTAAAGVTTPAAALPPAKNRTGFGMENAWLTELGATASALADNFVIELGTPRAVKMVFVSFTLTTAAPAGNRQVTLTLLAAGRVIFRMQSQFALTAGLSIDGAFVIGVGQEIQGNDFWTIPLGDVVSMQPEEMIVDIGGAQVGDTITTDGGTYWLWN